MATFTSVNYISKLPRMYIVLDTSVIRSDLKLNSRAFQVLKKYMDEVGAYICMPRIVLEEISNIYKNLIEAEQNNIGKSIKKLNSYLINSEIKKLQFRNSDIEVNNYIKYLKDRLGAHDEFILEYGDIDIQDLVERSIRRLKPLKNNGDGFRDGVLWLSLFKVQSFAWYNDHDALIFISKNVNDFADDEKISLNEKLQKEAIENGLNIKYFDSLESFASEYGPKIEFITQEWILENLSEEWILEILDETYKHPGNKYVFDNIASSIVGSQLSDDLVFLDVNISEVNRYFIYEEDNDKIGLSVEIDIDLITQVEYFATVEVTDNKTSKIEFVDKTRTGEYVLKLEIGIDTILEKDKFKEIHLSNFERRF